MIFYSWLQFRKCTGYAIVHKWFLPFLLENKNFVTFSNYITHIWKWKKVFVFFFFLNTILNVKWRPFLESRWMYLLRLKSGFLTLTTSFADVLQWKYILLNLTDNLHTWKKSRFISKVTDRTFIFDSVYSLILSHLSYCQR